MRIAVIKHAASPKTASRPNEAMARLVATCPYQKSLRGESRGLSHVLVVETTEMGEGDDWTGFGALNPTRRGGVPVE